MPSRIDDATHYSAGFERQSIVCTPQQLGQTIVVAPADQLTRHTAVNLVGVWGFSCHGC